MIFKVIFHNTSTDVWLLHSRRELVLDEVVVTIGPCLSKSPNPMDQKLAKNDSKFVKFWGFYEIFGRSKHFAPHNVTSQKMQVYLTFYDRLITSSCRLGKGFCRGERGYDVDSFFESEKNHRHWWLHFVATGFPLVKLVGWRLLAW